MRTLLLFCLLALTGSVAGAQDLLTKRNGDEVAVRVVEITPSEVKYRRTDNPDGPLISVWRSDVFMIRYANGTKEVMGVNTVPTRPAPAGLPATVVPSATLPPAPAPVAPSRPAPILPTVTNKDPNDAILDETIHLDGPRVGITYLSPGVLDRAREKGTDLAPFVSQFGWQFESRLFRLPNGVSALVEFVPLIGGLDQGKFLPSLSALLGVRGPKGLEFGFGPNITPLGSSIVLAVGTSIQSHGINFPINVAMVPGRDGMRVSLLVGFNVRHR